MNGSDTQPLRVPTIEEAERLLAASLAMNPGPWGDHSRNVAEAGRAIANLHPGLDGDTAFVMGLLHDIGRREGVTDMRHIVDGHHYLDGLGYSDSARICMSHSFPIRDVAVCVGKFDCTDEEMAFIRTFVAEAEFDDYDLLFQLCDCLGLPTGFCLIEKRFVDVILRHGINERVPERWARVFELKAHFEEKIGKSIYELLPGVVENTFNSNPGRAVAGGRSAVGGG